MINHIVLIGAGQIGSRHLQGLAKVKIPISIGVVDPSSDAIAVAKSQFEEVEDRGMVKKLEFFHSLSDLRSNIDLAIIATNADVRKQIIKELLHSRQIKYLILEKVAFQSTEDFLEILSLLKEHHVAAWVNCTRRMYPIYQEIKNSFREDERLFLNFQGGAWGMGSNSIHIIDLLSFFSNESFFKISSSGLDTKFDENKRKGFLEFTGKLWGRSSNGSEFSLVSYKNSEMKAVMSILGKRAHFIVMESERKFLKTTEATKGKWEEHSFEIPYQSQLTNLVVQQLLGNETCKLTPIEQSYQLHKPMLTAFLRHLDICTGKKNSQCPIT